MRPDQLQALCRAHCGKTRKTCQLVRYHFVDSWVPGRRTPSSKQIEERIEAVRLNGLVDQAERAEGNLEFFVGPHAHRAVLSQLMVPLPWQLYPRRNTSAILHNQKLVSAFTAHSSIVQATFTAQQVNRDIQDASFPVSGSP